MVNLSFLITTALVSKGISSEIISSKFLVKSNPSTPVWSCGNPSDIEQDALEHINRLRSDPITELTRIFNRYTKDTQIAALLKPYQQRTITGELEALSTTVNRLLTSIGIEFAARKKVLPMSAAPLSFYPLIQSRASDLKTIFYNSEVSLKVANPVTIFSPTYPNSEPPPSYLYSPVILFNNTFSDTNAVSWSGSNATGGIVTFGPYGGNETMVTWCNLSTEQGISIDSLTAFLFLTQSYPALFTQGPYTPAFTLGNGRLVGIDISTRSDSPGSGDTIFTADVADPQAFTSGSDLPFGATHTLFITGVIYHDANANGIYDAGEGISGITISSSSSPYCAISSNSGGYSIPVNAGTGNTLVSIQTPTGLQTQQVSINQDSVKVDFILNQSLGTTPLLNLSSRSYINGPSSSLISGFVIGGSVNESVLIRGIGPTLAQFGVTNVLPTPNLLIYNSLGQLIAQNSCWTTNANKLILTTVSAEVGAFALSDTSLDCALLLNLTPGSYTAQVTGLNGSSGETMIEIYHVPSL